MSPPRLRSRLAVLGSLLALSTTPAVLLSGLALSPTAAAATPARASFTQIENDLMCIACHESLAVAQSPESYSERQFVRTLIARGLTKRQIENEMVAQYGPAVLAKPPASGFNLTVYILPPLIMIVGVVVLLMTIPRWRRREREAGAEEPSPAGRELDPADADRLEQDLARQR